MYEFVIPHPVKRLNTNLSSIVLRIGSKHCLLLTYKIVMVRMTVPSFTPFNNRFPLTKYLVNMERIDSA